MVLHRNHELTGYTHVMVVITIPTHLDEELLNSERNMSNVETCQHIVYAPKSLSDCTDDLEHRRGLL